MLRGNKRKAAFEALTSYADELRTEIEHQVARLKRELERVEEAIRTLSGEVAQEIGQGQPRPLGVGDKFAGMGPQAAVERFMAEHPGESFRPAEMAAQLKAQGFSVSNPKLATQQVAIALGRAVQKGLAVQFEAGGKKVFRWKQDDGPARQG